MEVSQRRKIYAAVCLTQIADAHIAALPHFTHICLKGKRIMPEQPHGAKLCCRFQNGALSQIGIAADRDAAAQFTHISGIR